MEQKERESTKYLVQKTLLIEIFLEVFFFFFKLYLRIYFFAREVWIHFLWGLLLTKTKTANTLDPCYCPRENSAEIMSTHPTSRGSIWSTASRNSSGAELQRPQGFQSAGCSLNIESI